MLADAITRGRRVQGSKRSYEPPDDAMSRLGSSRSGVAGGTTSTSSGCPCASDRDPLLRGLCDGFEHKLGNTTLSYREALFERSRGRRAVNVERRSPRDRLVAGER